MKHPEKIVEAMFPTGRETAEVLQPCREPFNSPLAPVAAQDAAVLRAVCPIAALWGDHLDSSATVAALGNLLRIAPLGSLAKIELSALGSWR
jgi:hypothetical protein